MGLNVNLQEMLGLPSQVTCPKCKSISDTTFSDFDIECGDPNVGRGQWKFDYYCMTCDHEWSDTFNVKLEKNRK